MRFVCDSCRAQYMISDEKVGAKGVKVRCKKCGFVILVRRPQDVAAAPPPPPPVDDGADATQLLQNPLGTDGAGASIDVDVATPGQGSVPPAGNSVLAGLADDEIGAVFDQVLASGSHKTQSGDGRANGGDDLNGLGDEDGDDRLSTRVLDAETVRRLAEEASASESSDDGEQADPPGAEAAKHDWFVAIEEQQVGPLSLEKVKEHWDHGQIGPDSLCWRAGFSDWIPLSDVEELGPVLAPQPRKPVIVGTAAVDAPLGAASGALGAEVPSSGPGAAEDVGWKPSAASALASLVKEEIEALAKPTAPAKPKAEEPAPKEKPQRHGLLDLPTSENAIPKDLLSVPAQPAAPNVAAPVPVLTPASAPQPYAPPVYQAAPPPKSNKALIAVGGAVLVLLLVLTAGVVYLLAKKDAPAVAQPVPVAQNPAPTPAPAPEVQAPPPQTQPAAVAATETKPAAEEPAKEEAAKEEAKEVARRGEPKREESRREEPSRRERYRREVASAPRETRQEAPAKVDVPTGDTDDEFAAAFGDKTSKSAPKQTASRPQKTVYVPPAPGSANIPERLGTSDIMSVVLQNKPAIVKCVSEQKQKDPSTSGKLVMRWTIRTNGRTSNVSVQTSEFRSTYVASCISGLIKGWRFPAHQVQGDPVDFPFTF